jgi:hypothetical protein
MTIKEELEQIARVCATSQEYTDKAKAYLKNCKGLTQPLMSDSELRDIYRKIDFQREIDKGWEKYDNTIDTMLKQRADCDNLWYETWIDLRETWEEKWMQSFRFMNDKEIVEVCAKFLNERDRFYGSPDYVDMLNKMIKDL